MRQRLDDILNRDEGGLGSTGSVRATDETARHESASAFVATMPADMSNERDVPHDAIPAWLKRRRQNAAGQPITADAASEADSATVVHTNVVDDVAADQTKKSNAQSPAHGEEEASRPWTVRLKQWLKSEDAVGYAVSMVVHACLLLAMAIVILPQMSGDQGISVLVTEADENSTDLFEVVNTSIDPPGVAAEPKLSVPTEIATVTSPLAEPVNAFDVTSAVPEAQPDGDGDAPGEGSGGLIRLFGKAPGANAVTRGSFTVWTEPKDPRPGESYLILVRIKLPKELRRYPVKDLSGVVIGTDNYRQDIPYSQTNPPPRPLKYLPIRENYTQFTVEVPGAARLVRDRIEIRSKLLEESQVIEIEF